MVRKRGKTYPIVFSVVSALSLGLPRNARLHVLEAWSLGLLMTSVVGFAAQLITTPNMRVPTLHGPDAVCHPFLKALRGNARERLGCFENTRVSHHSRLGPRS